ncbi:hypothetical protein B5S29_g2589 [[Candida] boidinii]|nr:hypothetical protein B5S29_g2589 [[Candida] boidinii]
MGLFSKSDSKSPKKKSDKIQLSKITQDDEKRFKMRSQNIHDPILQAVNEAQPYEELNEHQRQSSFNSDGIANVTAGGMKDIFGTPIYNPDISNPSRNRDERPLDTIRSFEFAITGDTVYKQQLETPQLGWRTRPDFPTFGSNPYENGQQQQQQPNSYDEYGQPIYNNAQQQSTSQGVYTPAVQAPKDEKKKKRGFFGRKKKDKN